LTITFDFGGDGLLSQKELRTIAKRKSILVFACAKIDKIYRE